MSPNVSLYCHINTYHVKKIKSKFEISSEKNRRKTKFRDAIKKWLKNGKKFLENFEGKKMF